MLVDANILLFAVDTLSPFHRHASSWLEAQLRGTRRIALPWDSLNAFLRVSTSAHVFDRPLDSARAWRHVKDWLAPAHAWIPVPGEDHAEILGTLVDRYRPTGRLVPDTVLAALALEHGLAVASADTDFARFTEIEWLNPLAA